MPFNYSINCSKNALVINLDQVQVEDIVEEKLIYALKQEALSANLLKIFYEPAEQALVELCLEKMKGNQLKTAQILGINRNTLKKKIQLYQLNIKELLLRPETLNGPHSRIFLASISSLNLLSACRAKMALESFQAEFPKKKALKQICEPVEKKIIRKVLDYYRGNRIRASQALGINRNTLKKKMNVAVGAWAG